MSLSGILPAPSRWTRDDSDNEEDELLSSRLSSTALSLQHSAHIPPYGARLGWIPRKVTDFGDGGAFPEIHTAQYPLDLGRAPSKASNALAIQLDADGKVKYDAILRQSGNKDKIIYSKLRDMMPIQDGAINVDDPSLQKPDDDEVAATTEATKKALEEITKSKITASLPVRAAEKQAAPQYIRYTPAIQGPEGEDGEASKLNTRIIRMVEVQKDPLEPPKFKINKKIPQAPPSPPPPVMHSPPRKVSVKDQQNWKIPPCISNWKNAKGYTIPLDKRLAADGRGLQTTHINENFAKLSEALYIADRKAREAVEMRAAYEKKLAQKEKEKKEEHLRQLAQKAREERAGIKHAGDETTETERDTEDDSEYDERNAIRAERHRDRQRERNLLRAAPDKRDRLQRERERDVSEKIALGLANPRASATEVQFDQRLFNQSRGMGSGFGEEDDYAVYDKPWRTAEASSQGIYRPGRGSKATDDDLYGDDLDKYSAAATAGRFAPDKAFSGAVDSSGQPRDGPVQFEKHTTEGTSTAAAVEEDPFGLNNFLTQAKRASKRPTDADYGTTRDSHKKTKN